MSEEQFKKLLAEQTKAITSQVDKRLDERFADQDAKFEKRLNTELASFFGQMSRHFDKRFDELQQDVAQRIDHVQEAVDGIAKRMSDDEVERAAMIAQLDRHERWHHQTADKLGLKLDYDTAA